MCPLMPAHARGRFAWKLFKARLQAGQVAFSKPLAVTSAGSEWIDIQAIYV